MRMTRRFARQRLQKGLSLIELMVALALGLALLIGLSAVYMAVKQSFRFQETTGRLQEDGTFALDLMARDLRMAGSAGCMGINKVANPASPPAYIYYPSSVLASGSPDGFNGPNPLAQVETANSEVIQQPFTSLNFIRGFDSGIPVGMGISTTSPTPSTTSDSLFFAGASSKAVSVSAPMVAASNVPLAADTYKWKDATPNSGVYTFIISDCKQSSIFNGKVTGSGPFSIDHSAVLGNAGSGSLASDFGADAIVLPVEWSFYYIATRAGASTPGLYRVFFDGNNRSNAEELVSNIEAMKLNYGENTGVDATTGAPTLVPDVWRANAAAVVDWSRVVAVRIGLIMVSAEDNVNPEVTLTAPKLLGQSYTKPAGASANRLRKEFSTTVVLRNRVMAR